MWCKPKNRLFANNLLTFPALFFSLIVCLSACNPVTRKMDTYLEAAHEYWGFEGTVLVAYDGRVVLKKGYGMANQVMGIPNTPQTKFFIGSITKQFTAAAILRLQDKGMLSVHNTVADYLTDFPADAAGKITIHHLLTHTSGIPNFTDFPEIVLRRTDAISPHELYDFIKRKPLEFAPGSRFRYSNSGYIVLGEIITRVSGQSYEAFLHKEILKPSGMLNSGYARREAGLPDRAVGYTTETGGQLVTAPVIHFSVLHTAGALYSTVEDMLLWDNSLTERAIFSDSSIRLMFTPHTDFYGYGWYIDTLLGQAHTFHTGLLDGFNTIIDRWPSSKLTIVVFSNDDNAPVDKIARGLARIIFQTPYDFPIEKQAIDYDYLTLPDYGGVFQLGPDCYRIVTVFEDELFIHTFGEPYQKLLQLAPDTFCYAYDHTQTIVFDRNDDGTVTALAHFNEGKTLIASRLDDEQASGFIIQKSQIELDHTLLERYVGTYRLVQDDDSTSTLLSLTIELGGFNSLIALFGDEKVGLFPHSVTDFFHRAADFLIRFSIDDSDEVTGCSIILGGKVITLDKVH